MTEILLDNGYPLKFIFNTIRDRLKYLFYKPKNNVINDISNKKKRFVVPYINSVSEKFSTMSKNINSQIAYSIPNTLKNFIRTGKDTLDKMSACDVVYKINCTDCDASYVGQTKRQLKTRVREHRLDINKKSGSPSVISEHRLSENHDFDWDNVQILDKESSFKKRSISEMLHIKKQVSGLNKQGDTELFSDSYLPILDHLSPI